MTDRVVLHAYGRSVALSGESELVAWACGQLPPAYRVAEGPAEREWSISRRDGDTWTAAADGAELWVSDDPIAAGEAAVSALELWIAESAETFIFVHSGCVVLDGRALLLPGYSMSGKSTLTAALVEAGALYFSDEFAVLDHTGRVLPYPRPLSIRNSAGATERALPPRAPSSDPIQPAVVSVVAFLQYEPQAGWEVASVPRTVSVARLLTQTVPALARPRESLQAVTAATECAATLAGTRGAAEEAAATLIELLNGAREQR